MVLMTIKNYTLTGFVTKNFQVSLFTKNQTISDSSMQLSIAIYEWQLPVTNDNLPGGYYLYKELLNCGTYTYN